MRDPQGREVLVSRTTMSHAFEAAVRRMLSAEGSLNRDPSGRYAVWVSQSIDRGVKKVQAWTVTKREGAR